MKKDSAVEAAEWLRIIEGLYGRNCIPASNEGTLQPQNAKYAAILRQLHEYVVLRLRMDHESRVRERQRDQVDLVSMSGNLVRKVSINIRDRFGPCQAVVDRDTNKRTTRGRSWWSQHNAADATVGLNDERNRIGGAVRHGDADRVRRHPVRSFRIQMVVTRAKAYQVKGAVIARPLLRNEVSGARQMNN